ncbi:YwdI family protein [Litchfieldia alkalitelluris]|uniref:YwdI family protein n=1 Tax=Litchfieldia alkalitelluris TaxID=304268 RepID=UPI000998DEAA|nr:YwdI family protein [Litchfieldia alkalitelluris]
MNISLTQVIDKMTAELVKAKQEDNYIKVRESLVIIKSLCELALDEEVEIHTSDHSIKPTNIDPRPPSLAPSKPKLQLEDGNGDSLFDF